MKQSEASIKKSIKALRNLIDSGRVSPATIRIAYAVEKALRWSIEDTRDWKRPEEDVLDEAALLEKELS